MSVRCGSVQIHVTFVELQLDWAIAVSRQDR